MLDSLTKEIARMLRGSLPFSIVNTNPQSDLAKAMSYRSVADAQAAGKTFIMSDQYSVLSVNGGVNKSLSSKTYTSSNAYRAIFADLENPNHVWDWNTAKEIIKNTSWYGSLGVPPKKGMFIVNNARNTVDWVNRESETLEVYMSFTKNTNNMLEGAGNINDIKFLDFKLYVATNDGLNVIDFLSDGAEWFLNTADGRSYKSNINNRNATSGWYADYIYEVGFSASLCNSVTVGRDPNNMIDVYERPYHYWAVSHLSNGAYDVFVPGGGVVKSDEGNVAKSYTSTLAADDIDIHNNHLTFSQDNATDTYLRWSNSLKHFTVSSIDTQPFDGGGVSISKTIASYPATNNSGWPTTPNPVGTVITKVTDGSVNGGPLIVSGSVHGLTLLHCPSRTPFQDVPTETIAGNIGRITINSSFNSGYFSGEQRAVWPLNDVNDRSGNGYNLTANGSITYTDGPIGQCTVLGTNATLDYTGTAAGSTGRGDLDLDEGFTIAFYIKTTETSPDTTTHIFPISDPLFWCWEDTGISNRHYYTYISQSGGIGWAFVRVPGNGYIYSELSTPTPYIYDQQWHSVVLKYDHNLQYSYIYIDGVLDISTSVGAAIALMNMAENIGDNIKIGAQRISGSWAYPRAGIHLQHLSISDSVWSEEEIRFFHNRMKLGLGGATALLTADDIDSVKIDHNSGMAIVCAGDVAHVMDVKTGLIYETHSLDSGTLNHADIISYANGDNNDYILSGSNSIKQITSAKRIDK